MRVYVWCMCMCDCVCAYVWRPEEVVFVTLCLTPLRKNLPANAELGWRWTTPPNLLLTLYSQCHGYRHVYDPVWGWGQGGFELRSSHLYNKRHYLWAAFPTSIACSKF